MYPYEKWVFSRMMLFWFSFSQNFCFQTATAVQTKAQRSSHRRQVGYGRLADGGMFFFLVFFFFICLTIVFSGSESMLSMCGKKKTIVFCCFFQRCCRGPKNRLVAWFPCFFHFFPVRGDGDQYLALCQNC